MSIGGIVALVIGFGLVAIALIRHSYSVRARSITASAIVRDNFAPINVTYSPTNTNSGASTDRPKPDAVNWVIGIVGVLVAIATLVHEVYWPK
jgi:hypothetical protein